MTTKAVSYRITKSLIEKLGPILGKSQSFYRDDILKGFALRVTSNGIKSFIVETRINNKVKRITLGKYGNITAEEGSKKDGQGLSGTSCKRRGSYC